MTSSGFVLLESLNRSNFVGQKNSLNDLVDQHPTAAEVTLSIIKDALTSSQQNNGSSCSVDVIMNTAPPPQPDLFGYSSPETGSLPNRDTLRWIQSLDLPVALRNPRR